SFPTILAACSTGGSPSKSGPKTLKILQWSHFVPDYDKWFDPWVKAWGDSNNVTVTVDHINYADIPTRTASEMNAGSGHDLILWIVPPSQYEQSTVDMSDVVKAVEQKYGKQYDFARLTNFNPHTNRYFGFTYNFAPDPGDYLKSKFTHVGMPDGPKTWEQMLSGVTQITAKTQGLVAGSLSFILNSISAYRTAQGTKPDVVNDIFFTKPLAGPTSGNKPLASEHVIQTYIIPKFSKSQDIAKEFLLYLVDHMN